MIISPNLPTGFTLFCDDIRQEVTGKAIIVGLYQRDIIFHTSAPILVPQLVASIWYRLSPSEIPPNIEFRVVFESHSGTEIILYNYLMDLADVPARLESSSPKMQISVDLDARPHVEIWHVARLANFAIAEPGLLKVRAFERGNEVRLGTIRVNFQPNAAEATADLSEKTDQ